MEEVAPENECSQLPVAQGPPVSPLCDIRCLRDEYAEADVDRAGFIQCLNFLEGKYPNIRRIIGDGNCFFRAFLFSFLERLLSEYSSDKEAAALKLASFRERLESSKVLLISLGYSEVAFEFFLDTYLELLDDFFDKMTVGALYDAFQDENTSNCYTWYMRLLTAASLRQGEEKYFAYVEHGPCSGITDMASYCQAEVEPMGKECEQVHIMALIEYLQLSVTIVYMDGRPFDTTEGPPQIQLDAPAGPSSTMIYLLYRPGHYDILYPN